MARKKTEEEFVIEEVTAPKEKVNKDGFVAGKQLDAKEYAKYLAQQKKGK